MRNSRRERGGRAPASGIRGREGGAGARDRRRRFSGPSRGGSESGAAEQFGPPGFVRRPDHFLVSLLLVSALEARILVWQTFFPFFPLSEIRAPEGTSGQDGGVSKQSLRS